MVELKGGRKNLRVGKGGYSKKGKRGVRKNKIYIGHEKEEKRQRSAAQF